MGRKRAWKQENFVNNSKLISDFCIKHRFTLQPLNWGYQLRIERLIDVYPVAQRWHWLPTGERGYWRDIADLKRIMLSHLEVDRMGMVGEPGETGEPGVYLPPPDKEWFDKATREVRDRKAWWHRWLRLGRTQKKN